MKFKKINGWSYKTEDGKFMISNCGPRSWFSAEIDQEQSKHYGWEIPLESSKVYHTTCREAQNWVCSFDYKAKAGA